MPERSTILLGSLEEEWDSGGQVLPGRSVQMWGTAVEREGACWSSGNYPACFLIECLHVPVRAQVSQCCHNSVVLTVKQCTHGRQTHLFVCTQATLAPVGMDILVEHSINDSLSNGRKVDPDAVVVPSSSCPLSPGSSSFIAMCSVEPYTMEPPM